MGGDGCNGQREEEQESSHRGRIYREVTNPELGPGGADEGRVPKSASVRLSLGTKLTLAAHGSGRRGPPFVGSRSEGDGSLRPLPCATNGSQTSMRGAQTRASGPLALRNGSRCPPCGGFPAPALVSRHAPIPHSAPLRRGDCFSPDPGNVPDGRNQVSLQIDSGRLKYALSRDGRPLVLPSVLGFAVRGGTTLRDSLRITDSTRDPTTNRGPSRGAKWRACTSITTSWPSRCRRRRRRTGDSRSGSGSSTMAGLPLRVPGAARPRRRSRSATS